MTDRFPNFHRIPTHVGVIPDGNRRWAVNRGLSKEEGFAPGKELCEMCLELGIREITFYGFTNDNTKRPGSQRDAFQRACVMAVASLESKDIDVMTVGNQGRSG
jgi:undecaprenyl diphosphate synthase